MANWEILDNIMDADICAGLYVDETDITIGEFFAENSLADIYDRCGYADIERFLNRNGLYIGEDDNIYPRH